MRCMGVIIGKLPAQKLVVSQFENDRPSGAKTQSYFCDTYGTNEFVPFQISGIDRVFRGL
jgi:hypothetical protein